jgi:hypothetical protein
MGEILVQSAVVLKEVGGQVLLCTWLAYFTVALPLGPEEIHDGLVSQRAVKMSVQLLHWGGCEHEGKL